jgi:hypothetical protein
VGQGDGADGQKRRIISRRETEPRGNLSPVSGGRVHNPGIEIDTRRSEIQPGGADSVWAMVFHTPSCINRRSEH